VCQFVISHLNYHMHSILQTSCDNISSKLQVTVKILQVIMTAT